MTVDELREIVQDWRDKDRDDANRRFADVAEKTALALENLKHQLDGLNNSQGRMDVQQRTFTTLAQHDELIRRMSDVERISENLATRRTALSGVFTTVLVVLNILLGIGLIWATMR